MFIFALVANATYVARFSHSPLSLSLSLLRLPLKFTNVVIFLGCSILVRSTEWSKIKANMPWLLDAAACVALDSFVSFFVYLFATYALIYKPTNCCLTLTQVISSDHNAVHILQIHAKEKRWWRILWWLFGSQQKLCVLTLNDEEDR